MFVTCDRRVWQSSLSLDVHLCVHYSTLQHVTRAASYFAMGGVSLLNVSVLFNVLPRMKLIKRKVCILLLTLYSHL